MWIARLSVRGLAGRDEALERELERVDSLGHPALSDGFVLLAGALAPALRPLAAATLGWAGTWDDGELALQRPLTEAAAVAHPALVVEADVRPDPPMFGRIREHVLRDPERAGGLAEGSLTVRVGWQLTPDRRVVRPDLLGVRLGSAPFPLGEMPAWITTLLRDLGGRVRWVDRDEPLSAVADRLLDALLGDDPGRRRDARAALEHAGVEVVRTEGRARLALAGELHPLRWGHPELPTTVRLAEAALLGRPDVLVVPFAVDAATRAWLEGLTDGDDAALEQVVFR